MPMFVDTSVLYALIDIQDSSHTTAVATWGTLEAADEVLVTSNYVILESAALIARRLGVEALQAFFSDIVPVFQVSWVDAITHEQAVYALLTAGRRNLSLVDCASFGIMRRMGIATAFTFDADFVQQGFRCIP